MRKVDLSERTALLYDGICTDRADAHRAAKRAERDLEWYWLAAVVLAGLAAVAGFIPSFSSGKYLIKIEPWMVTFFAAGAAGSLMLRRSTNGREVADAWYGYRDELDGLLKQLDFETPADLSASDIAALSKAWRKAGTDFGDRMALVNVRREAVISHILLGRGRHVP